MNRREDNKRPLLKCEDLRRWEDWELAEMKEARLQELCNHQSLRRRRGRGTMGDKPNPGVMRNCKKEIARIETVLAERKQKEVCINNE